MLHPYQHSSALSTLNRGHINSNLLWGILSIITTKHSRLRTKLFLFVLGYCYLTHSTDYYPNFFSENISALLNVQIKLA